MSKKEKKSIQFYGCKFVEGENPLLNEIKRLEAINLELLKALKAVQRLHDYDFVDKAIAKGEK